MKNIKDTLLTLAGILVVTAALLGVVRIERHLPCWMYETAKAPVHCLPGGGR